jgi:hypothetical protein
VTIHHQIKIPYQATLEATRPAGRVLPLPVYAPGGMQLDLLQTAVAHKAHGITMPGGIC